MTDVVVTGVGSVTPLGTDARTTWNRVVDGAVGVTPIDAFDPEAAGLRTRVAGAVPEAAIGDVDVDDRRLGRFARFGLAAAAEAIDDAGVDPSVLDRTELGVAVGSGLGGHPADDPADSATHAIRTLSNMAAGHLGVVLEARGPIRSPATACAAGSEAIALATRDIAEGRADVMVAGGAEAPVTPDGIGQFEAMRALATGTDAAARPFDADRTGFVVGEGAGILILESREHAHDRGVDPMAVITGAGAAGDGHHPVQPPADGRGIRDALDRALGDAGRSPDAVDWVCAHATGTPRGDAAEAAALRDVFPTVPPVTSLKGALGHSLGAAGALEAVMAIQAIEAGTVPPTPTCRTPAPELTVPVVREHRAVELGTVITNAAGFGGTNSTLVIESMEGVGGDE